MSFMIEHQSGKFGGDEFSSSGAWSPPTSRANFCEEDYTISFYVAEFVNSLTNLAYVFFALRYMYGPGSRGILRPNLDFMSISLLGLGIGSFLFHASLRHTLEYVDELSMLVLTWSMLHATLVAAQPPSKTRAITVGLTAFYMSFLVYYVWSENIIYQVVGFTGSIVIIGLRTNYLVRWLKAFPKALAQDLTSRSRRSVLVGLFGYLLWNIELKYCDELRAIRAQVGLPWAWLFEFHGWWHIFTAISAKQFMSVAREMRELTPREKDE
ncbi:alkaline ceramidase family protein [Cercophora newfieldiana]|uniref:Alkaline ceramidase family protein n=1 Tax=Cercophora newfieldiana TaxID=92897 RepID=A0AA39YID0_9PEZI|nr:alkaline ceramidase family protein [Cercophora newfieldiana]